MRRSTIAFVVLLTVALDPRRLACAKGGDHETATQCPPFLPHAARLHHGHWNFSQLEDWRADNCTREFRYGHTAPGSSRHCYIKRFSADDARACLAGKHLLFIGDSVTRHQYESLVILVETGAPAKQVSHNPTPHSDLLTRATNYNGCGSVIRCDSGRDANNHSSLMENRYYFNPELNINISVMGLYAYAYGHAPVGWQPPEVPFSKEFEWNAVGIPALARVIDKWFGSVDYIVANVGIWAKKEVMPHTYQFLKHFTEGPWEQAQEELTLLQPLARKELIWSTTTRNKGSPVHKESNSSYTDQFYGAGYVAARALGLPILDRTGITTQLLNYLSKNNISKNAVMPDDVHFSPFVNDEFNNVLLNMLCSGP